MAEVFPSTPQAPGLPETLATIVKWRDVPTPMSEEDFGTAVKELDTIVEALQEKPDAPSRSALALARVVLGNLHRDHGLIDHATPFYDAALATPADLDDGSPHGKHELANTLNNRGLCTMARGDEESLNGALGDFDRSIALRKELPLDEEEGYRWELATNLINRGDLLHRLGEREEEARLSYDEAISLLRGLPYTENPAALQRLALATANRGLVASDHDEARRQFEEAIALLPSPQNPSQLLTLCSALLNRGRHSLQVVHDFDATADDARQVISLLSQHEKQHPAPAELALQARHLLAHSLCAWLDEEQQGPGLKEDWVGDATDTVEEGLAVERHWERQGFGGLRPIACELFQLGLHVYRVCQPHFFAEFLVESMDPQASPGAPFADPNFQAAAGQALRHAVNETAQRATSAALDPELAAKQTKILASLRAADERLAALQKASNPA
ncbi:tetratricopeptide repeat protein [Luteolibacter marinus]|uniref:tetratricopeptide repeat protein n=1 Tax=Luteolibacter marinus TaxID=2776705 RepID=UPI0018675918|nr:tetratricopeptide repeat protein [Luteolibacter marinus]